MDGLDVDPPENWNVERWHKEFWSLIGETELECETKQLNTELLAPAASESGLWIGGECNCDEAYEWDYSYTLGLYDESEAIPEDPELPDELWVLNSPHDEENYVWDGSRILSPYEWDNSYTLGLYDESDAIPADPDELWVLMNSGLSGSEALAAISEVEGESDEYEELLGDLASGGFESYSDWFKFVGSASRYKTYLELTLLDVDGWPSVYDANEETTRGGDACRILLENPYLKGCEMDAGENSEETDCKTSTYAQYLQAFLPVGGPQVRDRVRVNPVKWQSCSDVICPQARHRPYGIGWGGFNGPGFGWQSISDAVICPQARQRPYDEIGWGGFNGPGLV